MFIKIGIVNSDQFLMETPDVQEFELHTMHDVDHYLSSLNTKQILLKTTDFKKIFRQYVNVTNSYKNMNHKYKLSNYEKNQIISYNDFTTKLTFADTPTTMDDYNQNEHVKKFNLPEFSHKILNKRTTQKIGYNTHMMEDIKREHNIYSTWYRYKQIAKKFKEMLEELPPNQGKDYILLIDKYIQKIEKTYEVIINNVYVNKINCLENELNNALNHNACLDFKLCETKHEIELLKKSYKERSNDLWKLYNRNHNMKKKNNELKSELKKCIKYKDIYYDKCCKLVPKYNDLVKKYNNINREYKDSIDRENICRGERDILIINYNTLIRKYNYCTGRRTPKKKSPVAIQKILLNGAFYRC